MPTYRQILLQSRNNALRDLTPQLEAEFYRAYFDALERALTGIRPDDLDEAGARMLNRRLTLSLRAYGLETERISKLYAMSAIEAARDGHRTALDQLAREAAAKLTSGFDGVPREAFEGLYLRRAMGTTNSYKSLSAGQIKIIGQTLDASLNRMVLDGEGWQRAAGRIVEGLVGGDPAMRYAARAFVNRSNNTPGWGKLMPGDPSREAIMQARKIGYAARMIARTEVAHAFHEGDRVSSKRSPVVKALKWNLSPRHPAQDICDVYAGVDLHGLGPGVYPPEYLPPLPHPHDLCFMTHELRKPGEWRKPKEDPTAPAGVSAEAMRRFLGDGATEDALKRTAEKVNTTSDNLIALQTRARAA